MNVLGRLGAKDMKENQTNAEAIKQAGISDDFNMDWEQFITGFGKMDKRIDMMNHLKGQVKAATNRNMPYTIDAMHDPPQG